MSPKSNIDPRLTNIWRPELEINVELPCLLCGSDAGYVRVHGHVQCKECNGVVENCCGD